MAVGNTEVKRAAVLEVPSFYQPQDGALDAKAFSDVVRGAEWKNGKRNPAASYRYRGPSNGGITARGDENLGGLAQHSFQVGVALHHMKELVTRALERLANLLLG